MVRNPPHPNQPDPARIGVCLVGRACAGAPVSGLVGWLVRSRLPAQPLDNIVITDERGRTVAHRPLPYGRLGTQSWDMILVQLGFQRAGSWDATPGGFACPVKPLTAQQDGHTAEAPAERAETATRPAPARRSG